MAKKQPKWKAALANAGDRGWEIFDERNRKQLCNDMTCDGMQTVLYALKVSQVASVLVAAKGRHNTMLAYKALESAVNGCAMSCCRSTSGGAFDG